MPYQLRFSKFSETSILVSWPSLIDENIHNDILNYRQKLQKHNFKQKVELINTYNSILIIYELTIDNINDEFFTLKTIYQTKTIASQQTMLLWEIPVCYEDEFAKDLDAICYQKQLSKSEIIALHSTPVYRVYFIGFLPGFLYLGGLESKLHIQRKSTPDIVVKKGSVAIGGQQTGIYPQDSPGGWHIIGNSPIPLFKSDANPPCVIESGDKVKFKPISLVAYHKIKSQVDLGLFKLKSQVISG